MFRQALKRKFDKLVYSNSRLNKILRNVNKLLSPLTSFRLRPYGVLTVRYKKKVKFLMATNETSFVAKQLFWKGAQNFEYTSIFEKLVRKCNVFLDVGANMGYYSILAAKANPSIIVHAFEPASGPLHFLQRNVDLNHLQHHVFIHPIALSNQNGEIEFFEILNPTDAYARHNLSGVGGIKKTHKTQENSVRMKVTTKKLDEVINQLTLDSFELIKIDTEGTENLILEGAAQVIEKYKPIIICETLFDKIESDLDKIMRHHNYAFFNFHDGRLYKTETLCRSTDNGVRDCFFVHPSKIYLIDEFLQRETNA